MQPWHFSSSSPSQSSAIHFPHSSHSVCVCAGWCPWHFSSSSPSQSSAIHFPHSSHTICSWTIWCPLHFSSSNPSQSSAIHFPQSKQAICICWFWLSHPTNKTLKNTNSKIKTFLILISPLYKFLFLKLFH